MDQIYDIFCGSSETYLIYFWRKHHFVDSTGQNDTKRSDEKETPSTVAALAIYHGESPQTREQNFRHAGRLG
jgi:hypothetical protein